MTGRHRLETPDTKPRLVRAAVVTAPVLTAGAVGVGVLGSSLGASADAGVRPQTSVADSARLTAATQRAEEQRVSRSADRMARTVAVSSAPQRKRLTRFTTTALDVRVRPSNRAKVVEELEAGTKVTFTGVRDRRFSEIAYKGHRRWVTGEFLARKRPVLSAADQASTMGVSAGACASGSSVEGGLTTAAVAVHRAVCNNFPQITRYLGYDAHGEHSSGKAIDIMVDDSSLGDRIAEFLKAHASELNLYDVIYRQRIWTPVRASEGWRSMPDRGSATANHFDHVHVSVN